MRRRISCFLFHFTLYDTRNSYKLASLLLDTQCVRNDGKYRGITRLPVLAVKHDLFAQSTPALNDLTNREAKCLTFTECESNRSQKTKAYLFFTRVLQFRNVGELTLLAILAIYLAPITQACVQRAPYTKRFTISNNIA